MAQDILTRGVVADYRTPTTATELAHAFQVFMLDTFGLGLSGGLRRRGGVFDVDLEHGNVTILFVPTRDAPEADRLLDGLPATPETEA
ncbi:hypothetical protein [Paludisphaera mucosa]|uniref:Uncharacterized protein n=1 Tax=Paludisphaera mucosa TaxID=3030827 RepID=A0ABT6FMA6_9BACT|nr:hypothetical protein [Paludisphaera mucosa]MDG3008515.1 hypothetical protein [Paludisphaera mucosa]